MKKPSRISIPSFAMPVVVAAVQLEFFARLLFMGRRKKSKYLAQTLFQHAHFRRK